VNIADVNRIDSRGDLEVGKGSFIDVNNVFEGAVEIGKNVKIGPNCYVKDSIIGDGSNLKANTVIEDSQIGPGCTLGPFARIRGGTVLEGNSELGNFVEANRSKVGRDSKAKHLTYLGDATLGAKVNIGAGTITCNYDGEKKYKTKLADEVFIGSNTSLVAPVTLGKKSITGAGSVITKNVPAGNLAIGRSRQSNIKRKKKK
jgi:bifunctional UDP-N-acetylglucosamine pyrophosphorylase/glucosamine-1-phosphate N-acetyltransferase